MPKLIVGRGGARRSYYREQPRPSPAGALLLLFFSGTVSYVGTVAVDQHRPLLPGWGMMHENLGLLAYRRASFLLSDLHRLILRANCTAGTKYVLL